MATINSRDKFNLYWAKKINVIIVLCLCVCSGFSQTTEHRNLPNYDNNFLHYGFSVGANYSVFRLKHSDAFLTQDSFSSVRSIGTYSFSLGFILNMRLAEFFDLRLLPAVSFYNRKIKYNYSDPEVGELLLGFESSFIELPLVLKYKAQRRGNYRMYMIGGVKPGFAVGGNKDSKEERLSLPARDFAIEAGFGLDIYYELFKFSPELRFSLGLVNLHDKIQTPESQVMERLSTYTVSLYFFFE